MQLDSSVGRLDVALVCMPFADVQRPSLGLGLLHAALSRANIRSEVLYPNFRFAETIGLVAYQALQASPTDHLLGEWCFSAELFPLDQSKDDEFLSLFLDIRAVGFPAGLDARRSLMHWIRQQTSAYLDTVAHHIAARTPSIVGCSSVFQQHCASLALLKRIRTLSPSTVLIMGGANCEGEMGLETLRSFPWVDCVVSGEADSAIVDLCRTLLRDGRSVSDAALPSNVVVQSDPRIRKTAEAVSDVPASQLVCGLDRLPTPDYTHYFRTLKASSLSELIRPELMAESSRGCWWGEKNHCTFCGLNGAGMKYRSKSAARVIAELDELSSLYGVRNFQFVDNIVDMSYFRTLLPELAQRRAPYELFFEIKSNLNREQVRLLADAGVRWVQPGIESLNDNFLRLLSKGASVLTNLQLLKWCREYGIDVAWNILAGVPGESDTWYTEMAGLLPALFHLQPPLAVTRIRFDRFSPYQVHPEKFDLSLTPSRAYRYVYCLPEERLARLASAFEDSRHHAHFHRSVLEKPGAILLGAIAQQWKNAWQSAPPVLLARDLGHELEFFDTRPCASRRTWAADGLASAIYRLCDSARPVTAVVKQLSEETGKAISMKEAEPAIDLLCDAKVMLRSNGKLLALAVTHKTPGDPDQVGRS